MSVAPGDVIQRKYRICNEIASGGMGVVYEATHLALERQVAVKVLHPHLSTDGESVARFHQEAKVAGAIGHPNICETIDFGSTHEGDVYLVMPLLEGHSLSHYLLEGPLGPRLSVELISQVCDALTAAHNAGVVHRDLKPANIFVSKLADGRKFVRLLDFGISKVMDSKSNEEWTRTGTSVGTPTYMAPEQARGDKSLDHRVDVYAVGVVLYRMLTGCRPFDGDSYNKIIYNILNGPLKLPRQHQDSIPLELETIILKAMSRRREERHDSAAALKDALCRMADTVDMPGSGALRLEPSQTNLVPAEPFTPVSTHSLVEITPKSEKKGALSRRGVHWLIGVAIIMLLLAGVGLAIGLYFSPNESEFKSTNNDADPSQDNNTRPAEAVSVEIGKVQAVSKIEIIDTAASEVQKDSEAAEQASEPTRERRVKVKPSPRPSKRKLQPKKAPATDESRKADGRFKTQIIVDYD